MNNIDTVIESCDREIAELRWMIAEQETLDERLGGPDAASRLGLRSLRNRLEDVEKERADILAKLE